MSLVREVAPAHRGSFRYIGGFWGDKFVVKASVNSFKFLFHYHIIIKPASDRARESIVNEDIRCRFSCTTFSENIWYLWILKFWAVRRHEYVLVTLLGSVKNFQMTIILFEKKLKRDARNLWCRHWLSSAIGRRVMAENCLRCHVSASSGP